ncbi:N-acetylmuramoyl-L-alanine amidase [Romboutsia timonensis]|uniref:N-acetylmuramoyl-L-alanine amidase n=1 Tax=Romboutsia timonensis TaxID=1776391 RepID=UPI002A81BACC|nr:N-acetylmuramoyl-L-alanine amidase [Romboutsia timonensis]MDY3960159.1 N-acetylmuramoyl-L-alanine amidase [Romboutsia timonensis]
MNLNIHAGHNPDGKVACGAIGLIKESTGNRDVKNDLIDILKEENNTVYDCTVDNGTSASDVINKIVAKCNAHSVDLDVSIHFNFGANDKNGNGNTTGVEVLVYKMSGPAYEAAVRICKEIEALGYKNRGVKQRTDLGVLKNTKAPALLVECCFVDDKDDIDLYNSKSMAKAIAQGILNKQISLSVPASTPVPESEVFYRAISGSFNNKNYANDRKAKLDKDGFSGVFLEAFVKDETTWYRVIAGSFKDKINAEQRIKDLSAKGYDGGFIAAFRK